MKRSIFLLLVGLLFLWLGGTASALNMVTSVQGTIGEVQNDVLGWGGETFDICFSMDSEQTPFTYDLDTTFIAITVYKPSEASFTVGDIDIDFEEAFMTFGRTDSMFESPSDLIIVNLANESNNWAIAASLRLPYGFLGELPISAATTFSLDDGEFLPNGSIAYFSDPITKYDMYANIYEHSPAPVPEPSTIVLMGLGLVGLAGLGRKRMKR